MSDEAIRAAGAPVGTGPTADDIRKWPATVDVATASRAIGISRSYGYELAKRGEFPVESLTVGSVTRVLTTDLMRKLGIPLHAPETSEAAPGGAASAHDVPDKDNDDGSQATPQWPRLHSIPPAG
ncbi:hypothetical protein [Actinomadura litoris]|uniref:hypothetical protein n=1 Tax=Actinomadura litoris TaxID=2678616 RepID=UPI001C12BD53|nr:hypothetical protein [Actinomadura litoris]